MRIWKRLIWGGEDAVDDYERTVLRRCASQQSAALSTFKAVSFHRAAEEAVRSVLIEKQFPCDKELYKAIVTVCVGQIYEHAEALAADPERPRKTIKKYAAALAIKFVDEYYDKCSGR